MAEVSPIVLRQPEAAERPFQMAREEVRGPLADVVRNLWSVEWSLPPGGTYDQQVLTHPCAHLTVEAGEAWVQGVVTRVFRRRLTGAGRVIGARLQRRFDRHLGVGPKWVLQRCRIQDALAGIESGSDPDWAALAVRLGFADQPHFVNTFTAVVGVPPGEYRRRAPLD